jgi:hypothetical protein
MMTAGGPHRFDLAFVNPLLERWVTDARDLRGFV